MILVAVIFKNPQTILVFTGSDTASKGHQSRHRRGKSETLRVQYINTKDVRFGFLPGFYAFATLLENLLTVVLTRITWGTWFVCRVTIGTWNVAGKSPVEDLDIDDWLCTVEPADMYIIG